MQVSGIYHRMKRVLDDLGEYERSRRLTVWRQGPSIQELELFAREFGVSLEWLATGRGSLYLPKDAELVRLGRVEHTNIQK